ncbi:MAG: GTPase [Parvularculaceae bacterium]
MRSRSRRRDRLQRAGTTRDIVETRLDLGGVPVLFADTASLRDQSTDGKSRLKVRRALAARAEAADLRLLVIDPVRMNVGQAPKEPSSHSLFREGYAAKRFGALPLRGLRPSFAKPVLAEGRVRRLSAGEILVFTKKDLGTNGYGSLESGHAFHVSAKTGEGMADLLAALTERAARLAGGSESAALTRLRHVEAVTRAIDSLERARLRVATDPELAAEDARLAARALGAITGAVDVEDVLGEIFSSFCIGK